MKFVHKGLDLLGKVVRVCLILLVASMLVAVTMQVIGRYVFRKGFTWTDEFARYCLIFTSILGAVIVTQEKGHISIDVLDNLLGDRAILVMDIFRMLLSITFSILVLSFTHVTFDAIRGSVSIAMHIPMEIIYAIYPVSFAAMLLYQIFGLVTDIANLCGKPKDVLGDDEP